MREQLSLNRFGRRRLAAMYLGAALAMGLTWLTPAAAIAQMTPPTMPPTQPPTGMSATSPLNMGSTRPEGIPLGSTEIATPGVSPITPSQGMTNCTASGNTGSSGALFDGGGLSGSSSLACANGMASQSTLPPSTSTVGRVGIPLGSTELGGAGISPSVSVPGPTSLGSTGSIDGSGNP
ncbi:hypothetical protein A5906_29815 [Bradyrhizobium sacchari]|uniref:Uncharacterized protein n=1 Tax=Bradyrhizobium sacchari TaxID=1399419 RepID=A0A560JS33_9BRAD|nr:hypothetical protein [Bradyrhizobium sacchari]OPY98779.1 hypothetical protein A5906_29815 [Bradyrhizobium sacchari]TWB60237.1 hypothetical protein FBZ94_104461 [Bradyrhizobium sacchari]TWB73953.1 hypothetical protein FBZ95_105204 [Bradyrhizobium sacchari]